jgi:hypothetical protein
MRTLSRLAFAGLVTGMLMLIGVVRASAAPSAVTGSIVQPPASATARGFPCLPAFGCNPLTGVGGDAAHVLAGAVFDEFGTFVANGVAAVLGQVASVIDDTTQVTLDAQWFREHFSVMRTLALLILLPMMLVGLISSVIHRDVAQLLRAGVVYVPVAIMGGFAAIELTDRALQVTDWATSFVTGDLPNSIQSAVTMLGHAVSALDAPGTEGLGNFLAIAVLLLLMAGALLIWIELLLRTGAIYVVVLFLPIAMSGLVWRGTVAWTRRMVEVLVALLLSKFVIVVVIDLAAGMITAGDGVGTVMQGATLLLLAAFAPFALLRLVPIVEAGVIGQLERMERRPMAAAQRATMAVARSVIGGIEGAGAATSVAANGGDDRASLTDNREAGGQLNNLRVPDGWEAGSSSAGRAESSPARVGARLGGPAAPEADVPGGE